MSGSSYHVCFGEDGDLKVSEIWEVQMEAFGEKLMPVLTEAEDAIYSACGKAGPNENPIDSDFKGSLKAKLTGPR